MSKKIMLGIANQGEMAFDLDLVLKWELKKHTFIGDTLFFEVDGTFYSMKRTDYNTYFL